MKNATDLTLGYDVTHVINALERQAADLTHFSDRLGSAGDYSAGFPAEDAERLREAIAILQGVSGPPATAKPMSKWIPTTDLLMLRRMGKLLEELCELGTVAARCIIQGIDEVDPSSGQANRLRLENELADVRAQLDCTEDALKLDVARIRRRVALKTSHMEEWEAKFLPKPEGARWGPGTILRYADGETALLLVLHVEMYGGTMPPRYYGRQCMGGSASANESACREATEADLAIWRDRAEWRRQ